MGNIQALLKQGTSKRKTQHTDVGSNPTDDHARGANEDVQRTSNGDSQLGQYSGTERRQKPRTASQDRDYVRARFKQAMNDASQLAEELKAQSGIAERLKQTLEELADGLGSK